MRMKLLIAISATMLAASAALAAQQPPARSGHFKPFVSSPLPPDPDGTLGMAVLSAVVAGDATVTRAAGATGAIHIGTGVYEVDFNRDISTCTYNISLGTTSDGTVQGTADVATRAGNGKGIFVETRDFSANLADRSFHAVIACTK